jgi:hypothetical protein
MKTQNICARLSTPQFMTQTLCDRKVEHLLRFVAGDHEDLESGILWNVQRKQSVVEFLGEEIAELERFNNV